DESLWHRFHRTEHQEEVKRWEGASTVVLRPPDSCWGFAEHGRVKPEPSPSSPDAHEGEDLTRTRAGPQSGEGRTENLRVTRVSTPCGRAENPGRPTLLRRRTENPEPPRCPRDQGGPRTQESPGFHATRADGKPQVTQ